MEQTTFTFRLETTLKKAFENAAKAQDRQASQLLRDFMRDYAAKHAQADLLTEASKPKKKTPGKG